MKTLFKTTLISILLTNITFAQNWEVVCPGDQTSPNISTLSYAFSGEMASETQVYGELDTCNFTMPFWDIESPACGGSGDTNILIQKYNSSCDDSSFVFTVGDATGFAVHQYNSDTSEFENGTILVNGYPCMSNSEISMTVAFYDWNNNGNIGLVTAHNLNDTFETTPYTLTDEEISTLKTICKDEPSNEPDYTAQLNKIIENTAPNKDTVEKLTNIDNRQQKRDDDLDSFISNKDIDEMLSIDSDLETFTTTFETTLDDTYTNYSDIFGFGGYGPAPDPISFTMLGNEYKVFDPTVLTPHIDVIRDTFALFAYLWGFIIVFRNT